MVVGCHQPWMGFLGEGKLVVVGCHRPGTEFLGEGKLVVGFRGRCTCVTVINVHRYGVLNWGDHRWGRGQERKWAGSVKSRKDRASGASSDEIQGSEASLIRAKG